ncbi:MAG: EAL domain-containing protein [Propionivibrio sp.]
MSMYRQLWLAIIVSMLLALTGSLFASMLSARAYLQSQLSIKNADNAAALALSLSQSEPDAVSVELTVSALFDSGHYALIRVVDPSGETIVERTAPAGDLGAPDWFVNLLPIAAAPGQAQISDGWKQFGTITLVSHSRFAYGALWDNVVQMAMALSIACLVGGYLGSLILRRLRAPLNSVIEQAKAITERRFVTIAEPKVPELRQLASAMNATVGRLKTMFEDEAARLDAVRREANCDPLTGLANRNHFLARLRQALEAEDIADGTLCLVRLANLKDINTHLGRTPTDDFLRRIAATLTQWSERFPDGIAARLNGADFAALLPGQGVGGEAVRHLLDELSAVTLAFGLPEAPVSIGYGRFRHGMEAGGVLALVDRALASAEAGGLSAAVEASSDEENAPRTAEAWKGLIRQALERKWVRLIAFPVVDFAGRSLHRESPLRLMFAETGEWLPAGHFLPIAERLQLMPDLDLAAVELALSELENHPTETDLAINLSGASIASQAFRDTLAARLRDRPQSAARLWLEVAETGAVNRVEEFRALCASVKAFGCRIGLEHFGHRLDRISQWHDLGLDYLKVDASFVRDVEQNPGNLAFLKGLSGIARGMGILVIAEGVASPAEMDALRSIGFDGVTGPVLR